MIKTARQLKDLIRNLSTFLLQGSKDIFEQC